MKGPTVSVGLPVYNGERFLRGAVQSVLNQDYEDFELIISDNASTDSTPEICAEYAAMDKRIRYYRNPVNLGAVPNFNRVFELSRGKLFKWLAYDDECCPGMLARCVERIERADESVALVYSHCEIIDQAGSAQGCSREMVESTARRPHQRLMRLLFKMGTVQALYGLIRSDYLRRTRMMGAFIWVDRVLLAELAMLGKLVEIPEALWRLRFHQRNAHMANPTAWSLMTWLDSANNRTRFALPPRFRLFVEYLRGALFLDMPVVDKYLCLLTVPLVLSLRPARNFLGRQKLRLRQRFKRQPTGAARAQVGPLPRPDSGTRITAKQ